VKPNFVTCSDCGCVTRMRKTRPVFFSSDRICQSEEKCDRQRDLRIANERRVEERADLMGVLPNRERRLLGGLY
jgi:hypothetical protein